MKILTISLLLSISFLSLASPEVQIINSAKEYPYKNLINRTNQVKVFYVNKDVSINCWVEITRYKTKWVTKMNQIDKNSFFNNPLSSCLPRDKATNILTKTFLQFGRGL